VVLFENPTILKSKSIENRKIFRVDPTKFGFAGDMLTGCKITSFPCLSFFQQLYVLTSTKICQGRNVQRVIKLGAARERGACLVRPRQKHPYLHSLLQGVADFVV